MVQFLLNTISRSTIAVPTLSSTLVDLRQGPRELSRAPGGPSLTLPVSCPFEKSACVGGPSYRWFPRVRSGEEMEALTSKILEWHKRQDPYRPLMRIKKATLYLYRHYSHRTEPDAEIVHVFFEDEVYKISDVRILPQDFGLSVDSTIEEIKLPLRVVADKFPTLIEEQSLEVVEEIADELVKKYEYRDRHDGTYEASPSVPSGMNLSSPQASPRPPRRTSNREKRTMTGSEGAAKSQKRRKGDTAQLEDIGQSFTSNSTGVMFPYDSTEGEPDPTFSNSTSFAGESAAVMQVASTLEQAGREPQRRRSKRVKKG
ncbi:hypothetical protein BDZ45DRAFT_687516 [Acephala macrosclerotiorum]|nr:hypothetical protein BDZ45DRAFT_687516 [Acephala macrosclerotiorum]